MANIPPKADAFDFSRRLREAMTDCGMNTGRDAGSTLARRYGVSTVNANAWLKGEHRPDTDRAKRMAEDFGVRFEWLYFGTGSKTTLEGIADSSSHYSGHSRALNTHEASVMAAYRHADLETRAVIDRLLNIGHNHPRKARREPAEHPTMPKE